MSDFGSIYPLIVDKNAVRLTPFPEQSPTTSQTPSASERIAPAMRGDPNSGSAHSGNSVAGDALADNELDDDEIKELQAAAAQGDAEAFDLLNQLGLPLGIAAGVAGGLWLGGRAGASLVDALMKNKDYSLFGDQMRYPDGAKRDPFIRGGNQLAGLEPQRMLPAPQSKITDQTASRFNQPAPQEQRLLPDLNKVQRETDAAYAQKATQDAAAASKAEMEKSLGQSVGMRLRSAAKAARRVR